MSRVTVAEDLYDAQGISYAALFEQAGAIYEGDPAGWMIEPGFEVTCEDAEAAAEGLYAAGRRFMRLTADGVEFPDGEDAGQRYTPNCVSAVRFTGTGVALLTDTKGELPQAMADEMVRILVEELTKRGVTAHIGPPSKGAFQGTKWMPQAPR